MIKTDIRNRADIILLVDRFYKQALIDQTLEPIFTEILSGKLKEHLPVMYDFWASILLREQSYVGNVMLKHIAIHKQIPLEIEHFDRWLHLWEKTIDVLFVGPVSQEAKKRATLMKELMVFKISKSTDPGFIQ